jgi:RNA polymerase sigma factor (TIGR02999 family)
VAAVPIQDVANAIAANPPQMLALDDALSALAEIDPRQAQIVEMRFFAGLTVEETAELLGISEATVKREWNSARAFLQRELTR